MPCTLTGPVRGPEQHGACLSRGFSRGEQKVYILNLNISAQYIVHQRPLPGLHLLVLMTS